MLMGVVGVLGTLINPYGPALLQWLLHSLGQPRPEITDWYGIELLSANGARLMLAAALCAIALIFSKRKRDWTHILILALVLWQSSHAFVVVMCTADLPMAVVLLWQLAQVPRTCK